MHLNFDDFRCDGEQLSEITIQANTRRETQTETFAEHDTEKRSRPGSFPWLLVGIILFALGWAAWKRRGR